jgi:MFS family permease
MPAINTATQVNTATSTTGKIYPWVIAILALLMLMVSNGMTITGITAFDESLLKEFGWARGPFKFRDMITLLTAGTLAPFAGILIDRIGVRYLLLFGCLLLAVLYFLYGKITSLTELYLIHAGFGLVLVSAGLNIAVVMTSQWFIRARGTAIGIALVGSSLGGAVVAPVIVRMLPVHGWRDSFQWLALVPLALFVLAAFLSRTPGEKNMVPLGAGEILTGSGRAASANDLTYHQAIRTPTFWALTFVAMASFYAIMALASHLFLHARSLGLDLKTAGAAVSLLFSLGIISKFLFGLLSDVLNPKLVFVSNIAVMLVGLLCMTSFSQPLFWPGIAITGFGWGGLYTLIQFQAVNNFGVSHTGKILGTITMLDAYAGGLGIWLTGVLHDNVCGGVLCQTGNEVRPLVCVKPITFIWNSKEEL